MKNNIQYVTIFLILIFTLIITNVCLLGEDEIDNSKSKKDFNIKDETTTSISTFSSTSTTNNNIKYEISPEYNKFLGKWDSYSKKSFQSTDDSYGKHSIIILLNNKYIEEYGAYVKDATCTNSFEYVFLYLKESGNFQIDETNKKITFEPKKCIQDVCNEQYDCLSSSSNTTCDYIFINDNTLRLISKDFDLTFNKVE